MSQITFFSLSTVTNRIQQVLQPYVGKLFWLKAEISSGRQRGGSFYCNLIETNKVSKIIAQMRCTIWSNNLSSIKAKFKKNDLDLKLNDGTVIGLQCSFQYNPKYGLSLKAVDAAPAFTLGELELKKKEILARLKKEGLLKPNKQIFVPLLPIRIGLITSRNSAAYNDFINTLKSSRVGFKIYFADSIVQGNQAEASVLNALETLGRLKLELVILIRGGGSKTDLFSLDNEAIGRKIAAYKCPVWTGIGHEIDHSILDHISNQYFKTPTAVAEEIVGRFIEMKRHLEEAEQRFKSIWPYRIDIDKKFIDKAKTGIQQNTRKLLNHTKSDLTAKANQLFTKVYKKLTYNKACLAVSRKTIQSATINLLRNQKEKFINKIRLFLNNCNRQISDRKRILLKTHERFYLERFHLRIHIEQGSLNNKSATIRASDPKMNLKRGFSLVYNNDNKLINTVKSVSKGKIIQTALYDGFIDSTVSRIKRK